MSSPTLDIFNNIGEIDRGSFVPFRGQIVEGKKADKFTRGFRSSLFAIEGDYLEFSIYDEQNRLVHWREKREVFAREDLKVLLPINKHMEQADVPNNPDYRVRYNFFRPALGSSLGLKLYVQEISSSRKEIRVVPVQRGIDNTDADFNQAFVDFFTEDFAERYLQFVINFGNNFSYHILNWQLDDTTFDEFPFSAVIKLHQELPRQIEVGDEFWIVEEKSKPYFDKVSYIIEEVEQRGQMLSGPNFDIDISRDQFSDTGFQTFESLMGNDYTTTQTLINQMMVGEEQVRLNVDYENFANFVKFSNAEERLLNFQFKLSLLEKLQRELEDTQKGDSFDPNKFQGAVSGTTRDRITETINTFDNYERWLYESDSELAYPKNDNGTLVKLGAPQAEIWFESMLKKAREYDKRNNDAFRNNLPLYIKQDPQNGQFILFVDMIGHYFDLVWLYIEHFKYRTDRSEFIFDPESLSSQLSQYISKSFGFELYNGFDLEELFEQVFSQDDSDQIYYVFSPLTGEEYDDKVEMTIYPYATEKVVEDRVYQSGQEVQKQIWRRLLNSQPHIFKTKGTARSIRALLSCYGIPATGLTIREFGGTNLDHTPTLYEVEDLTHALRFFGNQTITTRWNKDQLIPGDPLDPTDYTVFPYPTFKDFEPVLDLVRDNPKAVEIRFSSEFLSNVNLPLFEIENKLLVELVKTDLDDRTRGKVVATYVDQASNTHTYDLGEDLPLFEGMFYTLLINIGDGGSKIDLALQRASIFGNLMEQNEVTVDFDEIGDNNLDVSPVAELISVLRAGSAFIGGNPNTTIGGSTRYIGQIDSVRYWRNPLERRKYDEHTKAPFKYDWDNNFLLRDFKSLTSKDVRLSSELLLSLDFTEVSDLEETGVVLNESPNKNLIDNDIHVAAATGYSSEPEYPHQFVRYYRVNLVPTTKVGANALYNDKIRIQETNLKGTLQPDQRREIGPEVGFNKDSGKLGVYFSPQQGVNEDIIRSLGIEDVNELIGDPSNLDRSDYPLLGLINRKYWIKYEEPLNLDQYFRYIQEFNRAFFTHVRKLVPARVTLSDGLLLEPHILERYREKQMDVQSEDVSNDTAIDINEVLNQEGDVDEKEGTVDIKDLLNQSGEYPTYSGESVKLDFDFRFAGNLTDSGREKQRYTFDEFYEDFDEEEFEELETKQEKRDYLAGLTKSCDLRKVYRRAPFDDLLIDFIFPIQNETIYTHREYLYIAGGSFVYADPNAQTESPFEGQQPFIGVYDSCTFYSEPPINVTAPTGESIRKPLYNYERYRHYFYNREFLTADKRMKIEGVVNTRETTLDRRPPVEITFTAPERIIVSPTDRDASGAILEVD